MIDWFQKKFATPAILIYLLSLGAISITYGPYSLEFVFFLIGILSVVMFFSLGPAYTKAWRTISESKYKSNLFWLAFILRVIAVLALYALYMSRTGAPFEFDAADETGYYDDGRWLSTQNISTIFSYLSFRDISDTGYSFTLAFLYKIIGSNIIVTRIAKAILGAFTCILVYNIASRNFGEPTGRMAGIFYALMPNAMIYCGNHLKETMMVFLLVAFVERADNLLRQEKHTFTGIAVPLLIGLSLFTFRTVLGATAILSLGTALVFTPKREFKSWTNRIMLALWIVVCGSYFAGGRIALEVEGYWNERDTAEQTKIKSRETRSGNRWVKYATKSVMAPMIVALPFSTMVNVDGQYNQQVRHGGNFVKNYMAFFVILALLSMFVFKRNWRHHTLLLAVTISYLGVISVSGYANAERFLFPSVPFLMILSAYGVSLMNKRSYNFLTYWFIVVFIMEFGWAYFKLGSRGIIG